MRMIGLTCCLALLTVLDGFACNRRRGGGSLVSDHETLGQQPGTELVTRLHSFSGVSSHFRIRVPQGNSGVDGRRLVVFFHGNLGSNFGPESISPSRILAQAKGASASDSPKRLAFLDEIVASEKTSSFWSDFVLLAILVPTDSDREYRGGKVITWGSMESPLSLLPVEKIDFNADFADDLIKRVVNDYGVNRREVYFVGQSGGSLFLTNTMIPKYGQQFGGGAILFCGGEVSRSEYRKNLSVDFASRFRLHFHTTSSESEHLRSVIRRGVDEYSSLWSVAGNNPTFSVDGAGKHCNFGSGSQANIAEQIISRWQSEKPLK